MAEIPGKKSFYQTTLIGSLLLCAIMVYPLSECYSESLSGTAGQDAGVDPDSLQSGLSVYYLDGFWRNVEAMPLSDKFMRLGKPGKPITRIDHRFGKENVFDSGKNQGIGVQMMGFIHLALPGEWQFKARSNDGIVVFIEKTKVVYDPGWHSDQFSEPLGFQVNKPGWYKILLRYFQRKGTATLEFYWKPPGEEEFTIIPEDGYWHKPTAQLISISH